MQLLIYARFKLLFGTLIATTEEARGIHVVLYANYNADSLRVLAYIGTLLIIAFYEAPLSPALVK